MEQLMNQVALVTGATGGIGQAMIQRLAEEGANIVAVDIDTGFAADTTQRVSALGRKLEVLAADVTQLADIDRMIRHTVDTMGRLDILMNNAGVMRFQELLDISSDDWDFVCNVNLKGAFFVSKRRRVR